MELDEMMIEYSNINDDIINIILSNNLMVRYHHSDAFFNYEGKLYIIKDCFEKELKAYVRNYIIDKILK